MTYRIEVDPEVTSALSGIIEDTAFKWANYTPRTTYTVDEWRDRPIPEEDRPKTSSGYSLVNEEVPDIKKAIELLGANESTNAYMLMSGQGLGWHTNSNEPGIRTYYTFCIDPSVFIYKDPVTGEIVEDWDDVGWTARRFEVSDDPLFWHTVWSSGRRFSFGFSS
jgi:hypothetical protein|tara:strand:+ start:1609 stop:2103 length:495 start_codon:yes stop_codon:yes gene_type:complete